MNEGCWCCRCFPLPGRLSVPVRPWEVAAPRFLKRAKKFRIEKVGKGQGRGGAPFSN